MESSDKDSKTEDPSEKKVFDEREKGNVPISREASTIFAVAAFIVILSFILPFRSNRFFQQLEVFFDQSDRIRISVTGDIQNIFSLSALIGANFCWPIVLILTVFGITAMVVQIPIGLYPNKIKPELSRISLKSGWKRLFSVKSAGEFIKALIKLFGIGFIVALVLMQEISAIQNSMYIELANTPSILLIIGKKVLIATFLAGLLIFLIDVIVTRTSFTKDMRMSKQDIKDEHKNMEGDPLVKSRLRSLYLSRRKRRMIAEVPSATVILTNPTHFSIALRYHQEQGGAPVVVAKGSDAAALRIREIAAQHEVPIVENRSLVRSLYNRVEIDDMIPEEFYRAVAEVIIMIRDRGQQPFNAHY